MTRTRRWMSLLAMVLLAWAGTASGSSQIGTVFRVHVRASDGSVYFYVEGDRTQRPACALHPYWVLANETSVAGKQQLALIIAAQTSGRTIYVWGTGTCTRWNDGEDVLEIAIAN